MKYKNLFILVVALVLLSCKKQKEGPPDPVAPSELSAPVMLVKDIILSNLPSPYYHFEYDAGGRVIHASFASGLNNYDIIYENGRISEMRNNIVVNKDRLKYFYNNTGRVSMVVYTDSTGQEYTKILCTYTGQMLTRLERQRKMGGNFVTDKTMSFSYYADGNLQEITYHYLPVSGQNDTVFRDRFEEYDTKKNMDGFSLIHNEFFDHLVLLPGVQFQKNNPAREIGTGDGDNYEVRYTYSYNNENLPVLKSGELRITSGPIAGEVFQISTNYSY